MTRDVRSLSPRARMAMASTCMALGGFLLAVSSGFLPVEESAANAPHWVIGAAGGVFIIAGLMVFLANHTFANDLLAGVLLLLFAVLGAWVSLFGADAGFSGGLPFLSREQNILIGRVFFGIGSLISFSIALYAFRRAASCWPSR